MADTQCLGRLTKWSSKRPFGDGRHYFTMELRCGRQRDTSNETEDGLCKCCRMRPLESKFQDKILHARITEPIPATSYIYGGPRYVEFCAKYGVPSKEHVEAGIEAHKLAIEGYAEIEMAKTGREKAKPAKAARKSATSGPSTSNATHTQDKNQSQFQTQSRITHPYTPVAACAIETSVRPISIEIETVKAHKKTLENGETVMVDEQKRIWKLDDKGFVCEFLGLFPQADECV